MTPPRVRPVRADAVRNRVNILDAARHQITTNGPDVGMDQIAATAGVAVGTLYRHFPTKTDLVAAVISEFVRHVADAAEAAVSRVGQDSPAFDELEGLLRDIVRAAANNHAVKAAAGALDADTGDPGDMQRTGVAVQLLIEAAQADRAVREDLSANDFYLMVHNAPADQAPEVLERWVDLTLFGIAGPARR